MRINLVLLFSSIVCGTLGAQSFTIVEGSFTWHEAKADAESRGGRLAVLDTQEKIDEVNAYLENLGSWDNLYIGGSDSENEGEWKWVDGTDITVFNWVDGEPNNNGDEDYLEIRRSDFGIGLWNDNKSHNSYDYLIEFETLTFTLINGGTEYSVSDCLTTASGSLDIPSTYRDLPVTSIEGSAFQNCSSLTSITIPDSVTSIGSSAFTFCFSLTNITIPDSVTSIGETAFYYCSGLTSITIPARVTSIEGSAFQNCSGLSSITIPASVTSIGEWAFSNCSGLTSITIPASVTSIGDSAFSNCSELTSITIPASVTSIGDSAFSYCSGLTSISIPDSVTSIGDSTFANCSNLASVTIPDSVNSIVFSAFNNCTSLNSISFSNPLLEAAEAERDARLTMDEVKDARVGSKMIEISEGKADITMTLEETSNLADWSNATTSEKTIEVDAPAGTRFYRFKITE